MKVVGTLDVLVPFYCKPCPALYFLTLYFYVYVPLLLSLFLLEVFLLLQGLAPASGSPGILSRFSQPEFGCAVVVKGRGEAEKIKFQITFENVEIHV